MLIILVYIIVLIVLVYSMSNLHTLGLRVMMLSIVDPFRVTFGLKIKD